MARPGSISSSLISWPTRPPNSIRPWRKSAAPQAFAAFSASTPSRNRIHLKKKKANDSAGLLFLYFLNFLLPLLHHSAVAALRITHAARDAILHPSQAPSQPLGHLVPRAPQPRLQGILRDSQLLRCFARRIALHFAQHKRSP